MIAYWTNFAHTGTPTGPDLPAWQAFDPTAAEPFVITLAPGPNGIAPVDYATAHNCEFWASRGAEE